MSDHSNQINIITTIISDTFVPTVPESNITLSTFIFNLIIFFIVPAGVRTVDIQAVEGMTASFPCDLGTPANDKVYMVFWFRDDAGIPLYR